MRRLILSAMAVAALLAAAAAPVAAGEPTCSDTLGIAVHGQHIVGDYVAGIGHDTLGWPPAGGVGQYIRGSGATIPGGPGPGFHFPNGFAPGASFCNGSNSPGTHL
jgi:hypothetical protein